MNKVNFTKGKGLIPVVVQDGDSLDVLMVGYMNDEAFKKTQETGCVWFWSRSRKQLWQKGELSGNKLKVEQIRIDCDNDALLITVLLEGTTACHTGNKSCFYRQLI